MKAMKVIFYIFILFVIMSCAHTPEYVQFCENNKCAALTEADSQEVVFLKLTAMIKANLRKKIPLMVSSKKGGKADKDIVADWAANTRAKENQSVQIHSLTFTDIMYIDRETREVKVMAQAYLSHPTAWQTEGSGSHPAGSYTMQMPCLLTVKSSKEISFHGRGQIWAYNIYLDGLIDHIDADKLFWGSTFGMTLSSHWGTAWSGGYLQLAFQNAGQKTDEALAVTPAKPDISKPAKESVEVITAQPPQLAYTIQIKDQNNNKVLEGGEEVRLLVEIENTGEGTANDVSIELSGQQEIIDTLGNRAQIGDIKPKQKKVHEFKGTLPLQIPSGKASVGVEIIEGSGFSPKEKKSFQIAMRPSMAAKESVEVITAQFPQLAYTIQLKDQNNNKVLDGGEEIRLLVEIENTGEGTANDVSIELSGQKEIIDTLGSRAQIGDIKPKQKKVYEFKGTLPADIPSTTALLRVRINEINGRSPARGKAFQVAMKASETATEQMEIISEVDVDDIPPRIKGIENKNNYAVVIGISTYREKIIPKVKYAGRDAETMAKYLEHLASIPKENIKILTDSDVTKSDLEEYFENWLPRRVTSDSMVYIYYAGHGTPDPAGQDAFIVPYEGHPDSPGKLYSLKKMYAALNKLPAKQVVVMLDSCFSGAEGRGVLREGTRPLVMSVENRVLIGNKVAVIAGTKGNQMSSDYDKVKHGLFTYYVLRGLRGEADQNGDGIVDVGELYEYVKQNVTRKASSEFNRDQTPDLLPGKATRGVLALPIARTK